ncbi:unnamed protein product [Cladocopium goreaui]|uniref:Uncharacterized protein n=1 Tax=Cladocopium goreaui TaxID=2562237 RepID=A0A9P1CLB2_9DINO|nr:unnamed protein product [Cladocopium goreaui]
MSHGRPFPSPKPSLTASTCYEKSPQSWSNTSYGTLSMDTMQRQAMATASTPRLSRCTSPDFPGRREGPSRTSSEISSAAHSSIFEDPTAFGAAKGLAGPLMREPVPAARIPRPSVSLLELEAELEALYRYTMAPHVWTGQTTCSCGSRRASAWEDQRCTEPTTISRSSRYPDASDSCCRLSQRPSPEDDRFSFGERQIPKRQRLPSDSSVRKSSRGLSLANQGHFEDGLTGHSRQLTRPDMVRDEARMEAHCEGVQRVECAQQWQEVQAIAQNAETLRLLARKRRKLMRKLEEREQHLEQNLGILSHVYLRQADVDLQLHQVMEDLRKAFAAQREATSQEAQFDDVLKRIA